MKSNKSLWVVLLLATPVYAGGMRQARPFLNAGTTALRIDQRRDRTIYQTRPDAKNAPLIVYWPGATPLGKGETHELVVHRLAEALSAEGVSANIVSVTGNTRLEAITRDYGGVPVFTMGHSAGGGIAAGEARQKGVLGTILMGAPTTSASQPTLVLWGTSRDGGDGPMTEAEAKAFNQRQPKLTIVPLKEGDHSMRMRPLGMSREEADPSPETWEMNRQAARAIGAFLKQYTSARGSE